MYLGDVSNRFLTESDEPDRERACMLNLYIFQRIKEHSLDQMQDLRSAMSLEDQTQVWHDTDSENMYDQIESRPGCFAESIDLPATSVGRHLLEPSITCKCPIYRGYQVFHLPASPTCSYQAFKFRGSQYPIILEIISITLFSHPHGGETLEQTHNKSTGEC